MGNEIGAQDLYQRLQAHREALVARMRAALEEHAFSNRALFPPRQLAQIAQEETEAFLAFLCSEDEEAARQRGRHLAITGLGPRSILALTETLRQTGWETTNPDVDAWPALHQSIGRYTGALLEGYMAGREESILTQQEQTRQALLRALQKQ